MYPVTNYTRVNSEEDYVAIIPNAYHVISIVHAKQLDKGGQPYILHLVRVSQKQKTLRAKVRALLHDIIEDSQTTYDELYDIGLDDSDIRIIKVLTKGEDEEYDQYIQRIAQEPDAIPIKIADLEDNMDLLRLGLPDPKDMQAFTIRSAKYLKAYWKLHALVN